MSKHTPEPWVLDTGSTPLADTGDYLPYWNILGNVKDRRGNLVARLDFTRDEGDETDANGARIVACVNALAGMNPEALAGVIEAAKNFDTAFAHHRKHTPHPSDTYEIARVNAIKSLHEALSALTNPAPQGGKEVPAAKAPEGCIIDDKGVVRRVDTSGWDPSDPSRHVPLPVYADGEIWMMGEEAYTIEDGEIHEFFPSEHNPAWTSAGWVIRWGDGEIELNKCYSTREAAEAAKSKSEGGAR